MTSTVWLWRPGLSSGLLLTTRAYCLPSSIVLSFTSKSLPPALTFVMCAGFWSAFDSVMVFDMVSPFTTAVTHLSPGATLNGPTRLNAMAIGGGWGPATGGALGSGLKNTFRLRLKLACFGSFVVTV